MRPAHKSISAGVWIVREQAEFNYEAALKERPNLGLRLLPFRRSQSDSQLLFYSQNWGKVYLYVNKTLRWKPSLPNH